MNNLKNKIDSANAIREALIFAMRHPEFKSVNEDVVYGEIGSLTSVVYEAEQRLSEATKDE